MTTASARRRPRSASGQARTSSPVATGPGRWRRSSPAALRTPAGRRSCCRGDGRRRCSRSRAGGAVRSNRNPNSISENCPARWASARSSSMRTPARLAASGAGSRRPGASWSRDCVAASSAQGRHAGARQLSAESRHPPAAARVPVLRSSVRMPATAPAAASARRGALVCNGAATACSRAAIDSSGSTLAACRLRRPAVARCELRRARPASGDRVIRDGVHRRSSSSSTPSVSARPSNMCGASTGASTSASRPWRRVSRWPARLPLSTVET